MATRWSSEYVVAEHRDLQASAMAVDWTGVYVLLAGRRYVGLKKLDDHTDTLKKFSRQSKYDVGTAEWNPNSPNRDLVAITSNQRVEVLSLNNGDLTLKHLLSWHTRVVTDVNWHRFHPDLLASCSIDTFTHIWDLRNTNKPAISFSSVAGATQVCWNRLSRYLIATAHNGDIRLWDQRKGSAPVQYITAHLANIHGLDWSISNENQLATSSQDGTVKFFDTTNPRRAENIITAPAPVWRARYTPFGDGMIMVLVPPMRRGENSLLLWNLANTSAPVHTFVGHTDVVLEFEWRKHKEESTDFQLITWSKDQTLRIWQIDPFLQKLCGHDPDGEASPSVDLLTDASVLVEVESEVVLGNDSSTLSEESLSEAEATVSSPSQSQAIQPKTLQQEFSLINVNIRNITFDKMDIENRFCTVKAAVNGNFIVLNITFPPSYPYGAAPMFQFVQGTSVDTAVKAKLTKVLKHTAQQRVHKNRSCLEPCLRQLVSTLEQLATNEEVDKTLHHHQVSPVSMMDHANLFTSFQDAFIPFPRTSGAKFCNVGMLVCFCRNTSFRRLPSRPEASTPRSLSALGSYPDPALSISSYYFHDRANGVQSRSRGVGRGLSRTSGRSRGIVVVYDASSLFLLHRELAEKYVFDWKDVPSMCHHNSAVAASVGRKDLVQAWTLAALAATPPSQAAIDMDEDFPWSVHPFAKDMIQSLISHYAKHCDIQMAAMLCCAFGSRPEHQDGFKLKILSKSANITPGGSPYHTIHQVDTSLDGRWNFSILKQNRSNSWSESLDDCRLGHIVEHFPVDTESDRSLKLDESNLHLYDEYKRAYAEVLHRWYLLDARAQVLKYMSGLPEPHRGVDIKADCQYCRKPGQDAFCTACKKPCLQCVICHISVRGSSNFCLVCGHGGHATHMQQWFKMESVCPSGCGCHCLIETASVLES